MCVITLERSNVGTWSNNEEVTLLFLTWCLPWGFRTRVPPGYTAETPALEAAGFHRVFSFVLM